MVEEDSPDGGITEYAYNGAGDLVEVMDDAGNITSITYNTLGQKVSMSDPDMGAWTYTYDLNGNLYQQTDAKGQTITFLYDALNRITQKTYSTSDPAVNYYYDNLSIANGRGRLNYVTNGNATTTYNGYDVMGRVLSVTKTITGDQARTTSFTYDLSGKPIRTTYPDGFWVQNNYYSGTNLLNTVTASDGVTYASIASYSPSGKIKTLSHGNGSSTTYTYDDRSEKLVELETKRAGGVTIQKKSYGYTSIGEIDSISDIHNGVYSYEYDSLSRLKSEVINGSTTSMSTSYDSLGNITSKTMNGNSFIYAYDGSQAHAVSSITYGTQHNFTYDANGNMTYGWDFTNPSSPKSRAITYNADNMPSQIVHSSLGTTNYLYDGMGTRVKKSVGSTHTYYIGDHFEVKGGTITRYVFAGNLRVAQVKGGVRSYFHKDHLGSSTVMTNNDGAEVESTEYMPFGSQRNHSGTNTSDYRFTDQELDSENGLYNYNARLYDPIIGRFISPDTIVPQPYNPQSLNRYTYCLNNPLIYTDPSGHEEDEYTLPVTVVHGDMWDWVKQLEAERAAIQDQMMNGMGHIPWVHELMEQALMQFESMMASFVGVGGKKSPSIWVGFDAEMYDQVKNDGSNTIYSFLKKNTKFVKDPSFDDFVNALNEYDVVLLNLHVDRSRYSLEGGRNPIILYNGLIFSDNSHFLTELNPSGINARIVGVVSCFNIKTQNEWNSLNISPTSTIYMDLSAPMSEKGATPETRDAVQGTKNISDLVQELITNGLP